MNTLRHVSMVMAIAMLAGCSMVQTVPLDHGAKVSSGETSTPFTPAISDYALPKTLVKIGDLDKSVESITLTPVVVPDDRHVYALQYSSSVLSSDDLNIGIDEGTRFISSVNGVAIDQTGEIIKAGAASAARISTFFSAATPTEVIVDLHDEQWRGRARRILLERYGLDFGCIGGCGDAAAPVTSPVDVILFRAPRSVQVYLCNGPCRPDLENVATYFPNIASYGASPLLGLNVARSAFVTRTTTVAYGKEGRITSTKHVKPSEGLGAARLPGAVVGSIVSGITEGMTDQTSIINAEKDLAAANANLAKEQAALMAKQLELLKARQALQAEIDAAAARAQSGTGDAPPQ